MYSDINDADEYYSSRLNSDIWFDADNNDKIAALTMAENIINRLPFIGSKLCCTQTEPFPRSYRGQVISIPDDIKKGIYEEALYLLINSQNLNMSIPEGVQSMSLGSASVSFKDYSGIGISKNSSCYISGWLKQGFDIEPEKFREVY